jgi:hypothetical protein
MPLRIKAPFLSYKIQRNKEQNIMANEVGVIANLSDYGFELGIRYRDGKEDFLGNGSAIEVQYDDKSWHSGIVVADYVSGAYYLQESGTENKQMLNLDMPARKA